MAGLSATRNNFEGAARRGNLLSRTVGTRAIIVERRDVGVGCPFHISAVSSTNVQRKASAEESLVEGIAGGNDALSFNPPNIQWPWVPVMELLNRLRGRAALRSKTGLRTGT